MELAKMNYVVTPAARAFLARWTSALQSGQVQAFPAQINALVPWLSDFGLRPERATDRYPMAGKEFAEQYLRALSHVSRLARTNTVNKQFNSYGLKHFWERLPAAYISNGAVILAAAYQGFDVVGANRSFPNAHFNAEQTVA